MTRDRILEAATREFAGKGYDGARVDEIARASEVSKNLIYHYFGSKDNLFTAVLERVYETIRERQGDLSIRNMAPEAGMRHLVESIAEIWETVPEFGWLLASENLHGARHVRRSSRIIPMYNPLMQTLRDLLKRGEDAGVFRGGIDPIDLYISVTALTAYYQSHRHTFEAIFGTELADPARLRQRREHAVEMILRYLRRN